MTDTVQLREDFNELAVMPRLLILVSPTCPMCLQGVRTIADALAQDRDANWAVLAVWMMGEPADSRAEAERQMKVLGDQRARHYWDGADEIGGELGRILGHAGLIAWDLYAGYSVGVTWNGPMPPPAGYVHQMGDPPWSHDESYCSDPESLRERIIALVSSLSGRPANERLHRSERQLMGAPDRRSGISSSRRRRSASSAVP